MKDFGTFYSSYSIINNLTDFLNITIFKKGHMTKKKNFDITQIKYIKNM